jgi:hypothetical protein
MPRSRDLKTARQFEAHTQGDEAQTNLQVDQSHCAQLKMQRDLGPKIDLAHTNSGKSSVTRVFLTNFAALLGDVFAKRAGSLEINRNGANRKCGPLPVYKIPASRGTPT